MAKTGSNDELESRLETLFLGEQQALIKRENSSVAKTVASFQTSLSETLKSVGKSNNIDLLLSTERRFLENEMERYANSSPAKGSLEEALEGLSVTEQLVVKVRDPEEYRKVDEAYARPRSRIGGVPRDEARQFFSSHAARLVNLDKARMTLPERAVVNQRKINIRAAEKLYIALQDRALGRDQAPGQEFATMP